MRIGINGPNVWYWKNSFRSNWKLLLKIKRNLILWVIINVWPWWLLSNRTYWFRSFRTFILLSSHVSKIFLHVIRIIDNCCYCMFNVIYIDSIWSWYRYMILMKIVVVPLLLRIHFHHKFWRSLNNSTMRCMMMILEKGRKKVLRL